MIELNLREEAEYIASFTGFDLKDTLEFVYSEDSFYDEIGLNVYDGDQSEVNEQTEVYDEDIIRFVEENTELEAEAIERMLEAEYHYYAEIGLIDKKELLGLLE